MVLLFRCRKWCWQRALSFQPFSGIALPREGWLPQRHLPPVHPALKPGLQRVERAGLFAPTLETSKASQVQSTLWGELGLLLRLRSAQFLPDPIPLPSFLFSAVDPRALQEQSPVHCTRFGFPGTSASNDQFLVWLYKHLLSGYVYLPCPMCKKPESTVLPSCRHSPYTGLWAAKGMHQRDPSKSVFTILS